MPSLALIIIEGEQPNMLIEKRKEFIINVVYFALIAIMVYLSIKYLLGILLPFIISLGIAALLCPIIRITTKKTHIPRKMVAILSVILFYTTLGLIFSMLGIHCWSVIKGFLLELPQMYSSVFEPALNSFFIKTEGLAEGMEPSAV